MEIKICGITRVEDAELAASVGADYIGLILADSPRRVTPDVARRTIERVAGRVTPVLLFRDAHTNEISDQIRSSGVRCVQLHGREPPDDVKRLADAHAGVRIIKAWEIACDADGDRLDAYLTALLNAAVRLHRVILDVPKGAMQGLGGMLGAVARRAGPHWPPLWRAGGLTSENVAGALRAANYAGVDAARGVESAPGVKDAELMRRFVRAVREANHAGRPV